MLMRIFRFEIIAFASGNASDLYSRGGRYESVILTAIFRDFPPFSKEM
jgi:hypothetical protein